MKYPAKAVVGLLALLTCAILLAPAQGRDEIAPAFPDRSLANFLTLADNSPQNASEPAAAPAEAQDSEFPELAPAEEPAAPAETPAEAPALAEDESLAAEPTLVFRPLEQREGVRTLSEINEVLNMTMEVVDFRDANLLDVLRGLTQKARLNYVMNPNLVVGRVPVSLHLENVRLSVVLENILKTNNLAYVVFPEENLIRIVDAASVGVEKIETKTEIIQINWVNATTLAATLKTLVSKSGKIVPNQETNALIITDTPPSIERIRALIDKVDTPERQVQVDARLVDMNDDAIRDLGIRSELWRYDKSQNSPHTLTRTVQTIIPGTPGSAAVVDPLTGDIISPAVAPTAPEAETYDDTRAVDSMRSLFPIAASTGLDWAFGDVISVFGKSYNLGMRIQALESRGVVEVLANPKVVTLNNLQAKIDMTRLIPYKTVVIDDKGNIHETWQYEPTGVTVTVTPIITPNGFVRMNINTDQRIFRGYPDQTRTSRPFVDSRNANTNVIVATGDSVMIGGLRQMNLTEGTAGIPWFHEIPLLGWLFKSKTNNQSKTELYLFVTPNIIEQTELTTDQKAWYDRIETKWHLPDYFFDDVKTEADK